MAAITPTQRDNQQAIDRVNSKVSELTEAAVKRGWTAERMSYRNLSTRAQVRLYNPENDVAQRVTIYADGEYAYANANRRTTYAKNVRSVLDAFKRRQDRVTKNREDRQAMKDDYARRSKLAQTLVEPFGGEADDWGDAEIKINDDITLEISTSSVADGGAPTVKISGRMNYDIATIHALIKVLS